MTTTTTTTSSKKTKEETMTTNTDTVAIPADVKGRKTLTEQGSNLREAIEGKPKAQNQEPKLADDIKERERILDDASGLISHDREKDYGHPQASFERIAALWTARDKHVTDRVYTADDVAAMMALVKIARLAHDPKHRDSWVDLVGYGALGGELSR